MEKNTYTYKQILIGLRNEFLEVQQKLEQLSNYVNFYNRNALEYYFNLYKNSYEESYLNWYLKEVLNEDY